MSCVCFCLFICLFYGLKVLLFINSYIYVQFCLEFNLNISCRFSCPKPNFLTWLLMANIKHSRTKNVRVTEFPQKIITGSIAQRTCVRETTARRAREGGARDTQTEEIRCKHAVAGIWKAASGVRPFIFLVDGPALAGGPTRASIMAYRCWGRALCFN